MFLQYISIVNSVMCVVYGTNILAVIPSPSYSHQIAYAPLWKELSLRGHNVTVITPDPARDPRLINLTEIDTSWTYTFLKDISSTAENQMTMWSSYEIFNKITLHVSKQVLSSATLQDLIQGNRKFDVVIVEFFFSEFLEFADICKCPSIAISSFPICDILHRYLGNPTNSASHPHFLSPFIPPQSFRERLISTVHSWYLRYTLPYFSERETLLHEYFNKSSSLNELWKNIDMMFVSTNPVIQLPRPVGPTTIEFGGQRGITRFSPWRKDLKDFLDKADNGFIYFSLGSNVKSKELSGPSLTAIIEALGELPFKVLWKFESEELPGKPDNIKLVKWSPQQQVLAHPNIKLFVTQGGLQSMEEGIYSEVPFVVIPFFGDQEQNAKLMRSKGIAIIVDRKPVISKTALKEAILEVANNASYRTAVKKLKELALDTPMTGLEKAVWWTEYVIRHKGAKHLRNPAADLPFYQYYLLDVFGFLIAIAVVILTAVVVLANLLYKWLRVRYMLYTQTKLKAQ